MKEETNGDAVMREFLLGGLDEEQRVRIEDQFLTDSQTREKILAAEQELIEDYLEDSLNTADRERFVSLYARTSEQRRKLRITKSIKDWATTEAALPQIVPARSSSWDSVRSWLRLRPAVVPIAVAILIALVIAVWLNRRMEERNRVSAIEQELAQLNSPSSLREVPPQMIRLPLSSVAVRGGEQPKEIALRDDVAIVELVLPWTKPERYSKYRPQLSRVGEDGELYTIPNLEAGSDSEYAVRLRLPTHMLRRGHYKLELSGIAADGSVGLSEEYIFAVSD